MLLRKFLSTLCISRTKIMNLSKCYFRHIKNENTINITFILKIKESVRQFNFSRKETESIQNLITRIDTNVQKAVNKIIKAKKTKCNNENIVEVGFYDQDDNPIPEKVTCEELFAIRGPIKLKLLDHVYEASFNDPWVISLALPHSILAGFPVYPENYVTVYTDDKSSLFKWYRGAVLNEKGNEISDIHITWKLVGTEFSYTPTVQDIGKKLKLECVPGNEQTVGPVFEVVSKNVIEAGPGRCPFETRHAFTSSRLTGKSLRCVSYNILADLYCDSDFTRSELHPYCPPYALHIDYRKQLILKEILGYNADIICLQEVDKKIFLNCLNPYLKLEHLDGIFHKKGKEVAEGLATFYRRDRFRLLEDKYIFFAEAIKTEDYLRPIWNAIKDNELLAERVLTRSTVASAVLLQCLDNPENLILVGNTHLYFHPDADHIRLLQGGMFIYWMKHVRDNMLKKFPDKTISIIMCGDFNSTPSCGIFQLYSTGVVPSSLPDWTSNASEAVLNLSLEQDIRLDSACGTPKCTNFTAGFADCLDYIFYEKQYMDVEQVIPLPSLEELQAHVALPSIVFPSDHIALVADLHFKR